MSRWNTDKDDGLSNENLDLSSTSWWFIKKMMVYQINDDLSDYLQFHGIWTDIVVYCDNS